MKNKLVETVKCCFTDDLVVRLGALIDEPASSVEQALHRAVPLVLNALSSRTGRGLAPEALLAMAHEADEAAVLRQLALPLDATWQERSTNLLLDLLGGDYRNTVAQIAGEASIRPKASDTLLQVATTAVLGVLGRAATDNSFSLSDFIYWLHTQKDAIGEAMLAPVAVGTSPMPLAELARPAAFLPSAVVPAAAGAAPAAPALGRWKWPVVLAATASLGYFLGRGLLESTPQPAAPVPASAPSAAPATSPPAPVASVPTAPPAVAVPEAAAPTRPTPAAAPATITSPAVAVRPALPALARPTAKPEAGGRYDQDRDTYIYDTGRPIALTLADGTTQKVGANSTENRLYTFLASPAIQVDSVNRTKGWINFDRINFEAGKALLTPESALQLGNVASILNTFPNSVVKIGGYTDSTGDALSNFQLSEDRARAAMLTLTSMGVSPDRLQSKGYGPKYFVRPNNTPTGRALNRRVSIRVLRK